MINEELKEVLKGEVLVDKTTLDLYSHDTSLFEIEPQVVVYPQDTNDVQKLVKYVTSHKKNNPQLSLTARSGGTDGSGRHWDYGVGHSQ